MAPPLRGRDGPALAKLVDFHRFANFSPSRSSRPISSGRRTWWASETGLGDYCVYLPPDKASDKQFRVKLSLKEMQWKLAGIDLPQPMRVELAQQLINQRAERASAFLKRFALRFERMVRASRLSASHRLTGGRP